MEQAAERSWCELWREQCEAVESIRLQYGIASAFDFVVGDKLLTFAKVAEERLESARALPQVVSEFICMFTAEEIEDQLARIERARRQRAMDAMDVYDPKLDDLAASASEGCRKHFGALGVYYDAVASLSEVNM